MDDINAVRCVAVGVTQESDGSRIVLSLPGGAISIDAKFARMLAKQLNAWADYVESLGADQPEKTKDTQIDP
jgi:predicted phosphoribosyltransferase